MNMKHCLSLLLLASSSASLAQGVPAETSSIDFTGTKFYNSCSNEAVTVDSGELHTVWRRDFGGDQNGYHLVNRVAGHFPATGDITGDSYIVTLASPGQLAGNFPHSNNIVNGRGSGVTVAHINLINKTDPTVGVSQTTAQVVFTINLDSGSTAIRRFHFEPGSCVH